jgi:nucleotide-binding universal stress UspA family protein
LIGVVIVPLDGSELAEQVLLYARRIADRLRIPIHLRAIPPDASAVMLDDASSYLSKTVGELNYPGHISVRLGNAAEQVIALAGEVANPIIAMTTHGRGGLCRLLYGSVADQVFREANCPLLLIRSGTGPAAEEAFRSIMVPLDGSPMLKQPYPMRWSWPAPLLLTSGWFARSRPRWSSGILSRPLH